MMLFFSAYGLLLVWRLTVACFLAVAGIPRCGISSDAVVAGDVEVSGLQFYRTIYI
jgi:hypothetical protein